MPDGAKLHRMAADIVAKAKSMESGMKQLLAKLGEEYPDKVWTRLKKTAYGKDAAPFEKWIKQLLSKQPPGPKIRNLSLIIKDLCHVELEGNREPVEDEEWPDDTPGYRPKRTKPPLKSPDAMMCQLLDDENADEKSALSFGDSEYILALVFYGLLLKDAWRKLGGKVFLRDAEQRQLAVGWHDADPLVVGEAGKKGLKKPKPKAALDFDEALEAGLVDEKMEELLKSAREPASAVASMLKIAADTTPFARSDILTRIKPDVLAADVITLAEWMKAALPPLVKGKEFNAVSFPMENDWGRAGVVAKRKPKDVVLHCRAHAFKLDPKARRWPIATNAYPGERSENRLSRTKLSDRLFYDPDGPWHHAVEGFLRHAVLGVAARLMAQDVCQLLSWTARSEILLITGVFPCWYSLSEVYAGSLTPKGWAWRGWREEQEEEH